MTLSSFLLTVRKRRGQRSPLLTAYTCACVSGHGRCSQRCEGLQRHPEGTEESRSRGKGQRGSNFEGLDFYMISLSINVNMQRECERDLSEGSSPVMASDGTLLDSHSYVYVLTILTTREPSVQPAKTLCRLLLPCRLFIWAEF